MTPDDMKTHMQRALEAWNAQDADAFVNAYSDSLKVFEGHGAESIVVTRAQHREAALAWWERFPDLVETTLEMLVEGDRLFLRTLSIGTLQTKWRGIEPTGGKVEWRAWYVYRFQDGLIVEERMLMDFMGLFRQLGAIELPGA